MRARRLGAIWLTGIAAVAVLPASVADAAQQLPDLFGVGRSSLGDQCTAQFDKRDPAIADPSFDRSYAISCRGAVASRKVGSIRIVENRPKLVAAIEKTLNCGSPQTVMVDKIGEARARRCVDSSLGSATMVIDFVKGGTAYYGSAGPSLAGPLEQGLALAAGAVELSDTELGPLKASFSADALMASDQSVGEAVEGFNPEAVLRQGVRLNQQGLYVDSSRLLNDAISRVSADIPQELVGQLQLEAGLADSNIEFFRAADARFARARELLATSSDPLVQRKITSYEALHDINKREFRSALGKLDALARQTGLSENPLSDPMTVASLNIAPKSTDRANVTSIAGDDRQILQQQFVDSLIDWARSTALLALGQNQLAAQRIATARQSFDVVKAGRIDTAQALWLEARIERQTGRIAARRGDWATAISAFDRALMVLREAQSRNPSLGTADLASAMIERADIFTQQRAPAETVIREFGTALDVVAESGNRGTVDRPAIDRYLSVVTNGTTGTTDPEMVARVFRAVQLSEDAAFARQIAQLQSVVSTDPALASQFRERADLGKELTALRYQITQGIVADPVASEKKRRDMEARLAELDNALASNSRFQATDDTAASVKEIAAALGEGEVYFRLATFRRNTYGIAISRDDAIAYQTSTNSRDLTKLANDLRATVIPRATGDRNVIPRFSVGRANLLFEGVAGPAAARLASAKRIIVDPKGPLQIVPIGILVTDRKNVEAYVARTRQNKTSYEQVAFLARTAEIATALSPRSFLASRKQSPSTAPNAFIGFGQHSLPTEDLLNAVAPFNSSTGCAVDGQGLADSYYQPAFKPISSEELRVASTELKAAGAPIVEGDQFTDRDLIARGDMAQYRVIHFATHGFVEGNWLGCQKSPPSLLTSLSATDSDGVLTIDEIAGLKLDANLVFLAACDTAVGIKDQDLARAAGQDDKSSGSLEGLVRAFLAANARAVVATSWLAPDGETTLRLVRTFYATGRTSSIGAALRQGQLALMNDPAASHPFRWGAFFVVGDSSKSLLSTNKVAAAMVGGK